MAHVTIPDEAGWVKYTATASQTDFAFTFSAFEKANLIVSQNGTDLSSSDWTVAFDASADGGYTGGTVALNTGASAYDVIIIRREIVAERSSDFGAGALSYSALNTELDQAAARDRDLQRDTGRAVLFPLGEAFQELPAAADRANKAFIFNSDGDISLVDADNTDTVASSIASVNTVAADLLGANAVGVVASDLTGDDTIGAAAALVNSGAPGFPSIASAGTVNLRSIAPGTGISITNGDGASGNPTVAISNSNLVAEAGLSAAADKLSYYTGATSKALTDLTSFGRSLLDDSSAAVARSTLGLGSLAVLSEVAESDLSVAVQEKLNRAAKNNFTATTDPGVGDDSADGYSEGSVWINTTSNEAFRCVDDTVGAAAWVQTTVTADDLGTMASQNANAVSIAGGTGSFSSGSLGGVAYGSGLIGGRDVAADGSKLDAIESGATADQTGAEIKALYEGQADTNAFTDTEKTKLGNVEPNADVTDASNVQAALSGDKAGARAAMDVEPGVDVLAYSASLAGYIGAITLPNAAPGGASFLQHNADGSTAYTTIASLGGGDVVAANNLSDLANAATARTNLGLDSMATQSASAVNIDGGSVDGVTIGAGGRGIGYFTSLDLTGSFSITGSYPSISIIETDGSYGAQSVVNGNAFEIFALTSAAGYHAPGIRGPIDGNGFYQWDIAIGADADFFRLNSTGLAVAGKSIATSFEFSSGEKAVMAILSVSALQAFNPSVAPEIVELEQWHNAGDGGGRYRLDASDTTTADNGGTVIVDAAGNRWKSDLIDGKVKANQFGAWPSASAATNRDAIQAALDYADALGAVPTKIDYPGVYSIAKRASDNCALRLPSGCTLQGVKTGPTSDNQSVILRPSEAMDMFLASDGVDFSTVTITNASPAVVTWTAHGLSAGDRVQFRTSGDLPSGMSEHTFYYVLATGLTANTFQISTTDGGAAVNTSNAGSGTHTAFTGQLQHSIDLRDLIIDGHTPATTYLVAVSTVEGDWNNVSVQGGSGSTNGVLIAHNPTASWLNRFTSVTVGQFQSGIGFVANGSDSDFVHCTLSDCATNLQVSAGSVRIIGGQNENANNGGGIGTGIGIDILQPEFNTSAINITGVGFISNGTSIRIRGNAPSNIHIASSFHDCHTASIDIGSGIKAGHINSSFGKPDAGLSQHIVFGGTDNEGWIIQAQVEDIDKLCAAFPSDAQVLANGEDDSIARLGKTVITDRGLSGNSQGAALTVFGNQTVEGKTNVMAQMGDAEDGISFLPRVLNGNSFVWTIQHTNSGTVEDMLFEINSSFPFRVDETRFQTDVNFNANARININTADGLQVQGTKVIGAQQSAIASFVNSTGGSSDGTLVAVSGSGADADLNNNFTDIHAKIESILSALRAHGLIAT